MPRLQEVINLAKARRQEKEILADNKYHHVYAFNDDVNATTVGNCISQLNVWSRNDPKCDIEVIFNSPGGGVIMGLALFDYLQTLRRKGHRLTTGTMDMAASMAGILLQAGDVHYIGKESFVLIHEISTGAIGKIGEIEDTVKFVKKIQKRVIRIFAERSNKNAAYFEKHWLRQDWWLSSDECSDIGIVDEVR
jgi:ATP-dependent Clp endopeptidase proteolytic subunit ClpP